MKANLEVWRGGYSLAAVATSVASILSVGDGPIGAGSARAANFASASLFLLVGMFLFAVATLNSEAYVRNRRAVAAGHDLQGGIPALASRIDDFLAERYASHCRNHAGDDPDARGFFESVNPGRWMHDSDAAQRILALAGNDREALSRLEVAVLRYILTWRPGQSAEQRSEARSELWESLDSTFRAPQDGVYATAINGSPIQNWVHPAASSGGSRGADPKESESGRVFSWRRRVPGTARAREAQESPSAEPITWRRNGTGDLLCSSRRLGEEPARFRLGMVDRYEALARDIGAFLEGRQVPMDQLVGGTYQVHTGFGEALQRQCYSKDEFARTLQQFLPILNAAVMELNRQATMDESLMREYDPNLQAHRRGQG